MSEPTISEAASEKPRRGRPPVMSAHEDRVLMQTGLEDTTRRTRVNHCYAYDAQRVLTGDQRDFTWLCSPNRYRLSLMSELGRLRDPAMILAAADRLCQWQPTTKAGVAWLRRLRTGKGPEGDAVGLANALIAAFNGYIRQHPGTDAGTVMDAIDHLRAAATQWATPGA